MTTRSLTPRLYSLRSLEWWLVPAVMVTAAWTALVVVDLYGLAALPMPVITGRFLPASLPLLLGALLILDRRLALTPLSYLAGWSILVGGAFYLTPLVSGSVFAVLTVPIAAISVLVFSRWPAAGVVLIFLVSGSYGSLAAYWQVPYSKVIVLIAFGLAVAVGAHLLTDRAHDRPLVFWPAIIALGVYFMIVLVRLALSGTGSLVTFQEADLYIAIALIIGYAGWKQATYDRIARGLVAVSFVVGAYAVYRWRAGPSYQEYFWALNGFNFAGGALKTIGSLGTPQNLGVWTGVMTPFCVAGALTFRDPRWKAIALGAAGLCSLALFVSGLRAALVGEVVGLVITIALYHRAVGIPGLRLGTVALATVGAAAAIAGTFLITGQSVDKPAHSYKTLLKPTREDPSVNARLYKWDQALVDLRDRPFGYGYGHGNGGGRFWDNVGDFNVDNGYLRLALEQGFATMALFVAVLFALLVSLGRRALRTRRRRAVGLAIGACGALGSMMVMLLAGNFLNGPRALTLWVVLGLALAQFTRRGPEDHAVA